MIKIVNELAPCGVYCGACPSFNKSCFGCSSKNDKQRRTSREGCKIRVCCYSAKELNYCAECDDFPCSKIKKKLIDSHPGDPRYKYRHEIPEISKEFPRMEIDDFLHYQKKRWTCPSCGGIVHFYRYKCSQCGKSVK